MRGIRTPGALRRRLIGTIVQRFEQKGLRLAGLKLVQAGRELAEKGFFSQQTLEITANPWVIAAGKKCHPAFCSEGFIEEVTRIVRAGDKKQGGQVWAGFDRVLDISGFIKRGIVEI